jgi:hypothetical protein
MRLVGAGEQQTLHFTYDASGTLAGSGAQLLLPRHMSRSMFMFVNNGAASMYVDFGGARATCTISSGAVSSGGFTITNAGFGYTKPPLVRFFGGGAPQGVTVSPGAGLSGVSTMVGPNTGFIGSTIPYPMWPSPPHPAQAHAVLTAGAVSSIVLDDSGSNYIYAPYVMLLNNDLDPVGCALPSSTAGSGSFLVVASGGSLTFNATVCPTDQCGILGTSGQSFTCKYMT